MHAAIRKIFKRAFRGTAFLERREADRNYKKTSWSQFGEDAHLLGIYQRLRYRRGIDVTSGVIVDVGAHKPIKWSNTYSFFQRGWRTISIDPAPGSMQIFDKVRPTDTNLEVAIGPERGESTFFMFSNPSVFNTMDEAAAVAYAQKSGRAFRRVPIKVERLQDILEKHLGRDPFEILSIDAEGYDIEILRSNDFTRFRPRLILIEVHDVTLESLPNNSIVQFLRERDYQLLSWINPNLLFIRADSSYLG
jgi:FkbM family methyltransferase